MTRTADLGLLPEHEMQIRSSRTAPWSMASDKDLNPLPALLDAAQTANAMNSLNLPRLINLLEQPEAALRWWGALGLVALGKEARSAEAVLRQALKDPSPEVRIAVAEALGQLGDHAAALPVLTEALRHDAPVVRLAALNVLDRFGSQAKPALAAIRAAGLANKDPIADYANRMIEYVPARIEQSK
jgi:N-sulfoglucosamine sulfohydrolase